MQQESKTLKIDLDTHTREFLDERTTTNSTDNSKGWYSNKGWYSRSEQSNKGWFAKHSG